MKMVMLQASPLATRRTKNRLAEHGGKYGGKFVLHTEQPVKTLRINGEAILVSCTCCEDAWHGWLPVDELHQFVG